MAMLADLSRIEARDRLSGYQPYAKQREFHAAGAEHRERLFMAGNQLGKTLAGAAEIAMHLCGRYPDWWQGRRWAKPVRGWVAGETAETTRDSVQRQLVGPPPQREMWGTGWIPANALGKHAMQAGTSDAIDSLTVRHDAGGYSEVGFKTYGKGRSRWQAETLDFVWFDEEPPIDVYTEGLTRTNATGGLVMVTFTPLMGMSEVVRMFLEHAGRLEQ